MVLPKHMRLKGHRCFDFIYKQGSRFYSPSMVLRVTSAYTKPQVKESLKIINFSETNRFTIKMSEKNINHKYLEFESAHGINSENFEQMNLWLLKN